VAESKGISDSGCVATGPQADERSRQGDLRLPEADLRLPPELTGEAMAFARYRASALTDGVFALDEPWRGRFLNLIAAYAQAYDAQTPSRDDVRIWLRDERLHRQIWLMLRAWTHQP